MWRSGGCAPPPIFTGSDDEGLGEFMNSLNLNTSLSLCKDFKMFFVCIKGVLNGETLTKWVQKVKIWNCNVTFIH